MTLKYIPPYSFFIGRGNLVHAEASVHCILECDCEFVCFRIHFYIGIDDSILPDFINDLR